jgi:hypothetical protein
MEEIQTMTLRMTSGILENYGKHLASDRDLLKIWSDGTKAWRNWDEKGMRSACERFAKWEKRHVEAGL